MAVVEGTSGRRARRLFDRLGFPLPLDLLASYRHRPTTEINTIKAMRAAVFWRHHTGAGRLRQAAKSLLWLGLPGYVVSAVRAHGTITRETFGRSSFDQASDLVRLAVGNGLRPSYYYSGGLARHDGGEPLLRFIPYELYATVAHVLSTERARGSLALQDSKLAFELACRAAGLPVVTTLAVVDARGLRKPDGAPLDALPAEDLLVKPAYGLQGQGIELWRRTGDGFADAGGTTISESVLVERLQGVVKGTRKTLLLQRREHNHLSLADIAGPALSTIRLVTIINESGEPEIVDAFYRTAVRVTAPVDNFHAGGTWFPMDGKGVLQPGYAADYAARPVRQTRHPLTGKEVSGTTHPGAPAVYELGLQAHRAFPDLFIVGWDIAYTPSGPLIVEFNVPPGIDATAQDSADGFIGTRLSAILAFHARRWIEANVSSGSRWRPGDGRESR